MTKPNQIKPFKWTTRGKINVWKKPKGKLAFEQWHLSAIHQNLEGFVAQLSATGPKGRYPVRSQMGILGFFLILQISSRCHLTKRMFKHKVALRYCYKGLWVKNLCVKGRHVWLNGVFPLTITVQGTGNREGAFPLVTITQTSTMKPSGNEEVGESVLQTFGRGVLTHVQSVSKVQPCHFNRFFPCATKRGRCRGRLVFFIGQG